MRLFVSKGGKDCGGALILDYADNAPLAILYGGKIYARFAVIDGAVHYVPNDCIAPDENVEVIVSDECVGKSVLTGRVQKVDDFDDPRR